MQPEALITDLALGSLETHASSAHATPSQEGRAPGADSHRRNGAGAVERSDVKWCRVNRKLERRFKNCKKNIGKRELVGSRK